jgi:hypothetical protein
MWPRSHQDQRTWRAFAFGTWDDVISQLICHWYCQIWLCLDQWGCSALKPSIFLKWRNWCAVVHWFLGEWLKCYYQEEVLCFKWQQERVRLIGRVIDQEETCGKCKQRHELITSKRNNLVNVSINLDWLCIPSGNRFPVTIVTLKRLI